MTRLIAFCLCVLPSVTLAQQAPYPGGCDRPPSCPAGQVMDAASKACVPMSS